MSAPSLDRTRFNSKPSILLVVVDDAYRLLFAAYGSPPGLTPAIDAIALSQNGAAMREAFSPSSVCSPARLSILTGRYPSEVQRASFFRANGTVPVGFDCCWGKRLADQPTIHRLLRGAGYRTAFMGKAHMANHPEELTDRDARREPDELLGALRGVSRRQAADEALGARVLERRDWQHVGVLGPVEPGEGVAADGVVGEGIAPLAGGGWCCWRVWRRACCCWRFGRAAPRALVGSRRAV